MIKIKNSNNFRIYLISILVISILTTNTVLIISPNWEIFVKIFLSSILIFFVVHLVYYKFYWYLIVYKSKEKVSEGMLNSSITGGILISLVSIFNLIYTTSSTYNFNMENKLTYITFFSLIGIYLVCIFILAKNDIAYFKINFRFRHLQ